ncbi:MAG: J domain-containing protein [Candidatus Pelagibacter sp.]|nr:J domain-containing protein [Candidatus Pelagibacter sp.]
MSDNYYDILGVNKDSPESEIKKAYRKIAMKYHPDKNPGDKSAEDKFKEASDAYQTLIDKDKRHNYDMYGSSDNQYRRTSFNMDDVMNDIFKDRSNFGNGNVRRKKPIKFRGSNIKIKLPVTLEQIYNGDIITVKVNCNILCTVCDGNGYNDKSSYPTECKKCDATGEVIERHTMFGGFNVEVLNSSPCKDCNGHGHIIHNSCNNCTGNGYVSGDKHVKIPTPAGVNNRDIVSYRHQGNVGTRNGGFGDLIVEFIEKSHDKHNRKGKDIFSKIDIKYSQAILGDDIKVHTLYGLIDVTIPPESKNGDSLKINGYGFKDPYSNTIGNQYIIINILTPSNLNRHQTEIIKLMKMAGL